MFLISGFSRPLFIECLRPAFELRLDKDDQFADIELVEHMYEDRFRGNETDIHADKIDRLVKPFLFDVFRVAPFHFDDPAIGLQSWIELQMPDIERIDFFAPAIRHACVNPPVLAPISRTTLPVRSIENVRSAASSFS